MKPTPNNVDTELVMTEHGASLRSIVQVRQRTGPGAATRITPEGRGVNIGEAIRARTHVPRVPARTKAPHPADPRGTVVIPKV